MRALFVNSAVDAVKASNTSNSSINKIIISFNHVYGSQDGKICIETNSAGSSCIGPGPCGGTPSDPTMNLPYVDPPLGPFTEDGKTFSSFVDVKNGIATESEKSSYTSMYVPGGTIVHEFGHALGMGHEHQNNLYNKNPLVFNEQEVLNDIPSWSIEDVKEQIIDKYNCTTSNCGYSGSEYDPLSIMTYHIPKRWLISGDPVNPNYTLSQKDISQLLLKYPTNVSNKPVIYVEFVDVRPGEEWKKYWVKKVVEDTFGKFGIIFKFDPKNMEAPGKNTELTDAIPCSLRGSMGSTGSSESSVIDPTTGIIIGSVVGSIVFIIIVGIIIMNISKKRN